MALAIDRLVTLKNNKTSNGKGQFKLQNNGICSKFGCSFNIGTHNVIIIIIWVVSCLLAIPGTLATKHEEFDQDFYDLDQFVNDTNKDYQLPKIVERNGIKYELIQNETTGEGYCY